MDFCTFGSTGGSTPITSRISSFSSVEWSFLKRCAVKATKLARVWRSLPPASSSLDRAITFAVLCPSKRRRREMGRLSRGSNTFGHTTGAFSGDSDETPVSRLWKFPVVFPQSSKLLLFCFWCGLLLLLGQVVTDQFSKHVHGVSQSVNLVMLRWPFGRRGWILASYPAADGLSSKGTPSW